MSQHLARAEMWGSRWRAGCANCGWVSRPLKDEDTAKRRAARHDVEAAAQDDRIFQMLYGPRKT